MNFTIRKATKNDLPRVLALIKELARYEKEPHAVVVDEQDLAENGFGDHPLFYCYVAEMDGNIRGMALFYYRYSTWKGKTVHLEDLIVTKSYRGKGLGMALYKEVIAFAAAKEVERIEWVVLDWNDPAIAFYESTGAMVMRNWDTVQFDKKAYLRFLEQETD